MHYKIDIKNTNLKTNSIKIARNVTNLLYKDDFNKRKHGFNVTCEDRHKVFRAKETLYRTLKEKTTEDLSKYYEHLNDDYFNRIHYWKKEEILFIVNNVNKRLKYLVNSSELFRHSMDSIRKMRCAIRAKKLRILPRKIIYWLDEIGYISLLT